MKKVIFALFTDIAVAEKAINYLHNELSVSTDEISYLYRDSEGEKVTKEGGEAATETVGEGAISGAKTGGLVGGAIGLIAITGLLGPLGPVIAAGPLATFLGISGAVGTVVGAGATGAAIGGLVGALVSMGLSEPKARTFEERIEAGDVLVSVHSEQADQVVSALRTFNAQGIEIVEENM
jgi:uncharacterized membrane protein